MKQCCMRLDESAPVDKGAAGSGSRYGAGLGDHGKRTIVLPAMLCMLSLMVPATLMSSDYATDGIS